MSVTRFADATVYPIFREPGLPQNNPSILGRVFGMALLPGDASGGSIQAYFRIPDLSSVFGSHALLQVDTWSALCTISPAAGTFFDFNIAGSEYDIDGASFVQYNVEHYIAGGIGQRGPVGPIVPKALIRGAGRDIYALIYVQPQVTPGGYYMSFHALVLDERMI